MSQLLLEESRLIVHSVKKTFEYRNLIEKELIQKSCYMYVQFYTNTIRNLNSK